MNSRTITRAEYEDISYPGLGLTFEKARKLKEFLDSKKLSKALDFKLSGIKTGSYAGVIKYSDFQLNIIPKIIGDTNSVCLENLAFMLSYTRQLTIHTTGAAQLTNCQNSFLEVLIAHYADVLLKALSRQVPHRYEPREENLATIKGKILFAQNIRHNFGNLAQTYCQFDEFTSDNLLNQTLKFVSHALQKLTGVSQTRQKLLKINAVYDEVTLRSVAYTETQKIILNRNQTIFKEPLELAQMFLQNSTISLHNHTFTNLAILFDMNELFEKFVATALEQAFPGQVKIQNKLKIIEDIDGIPGTSYTIRPDILFGKDTIIDTKYKRLSLPEDKPSEADIYQMLAYNRFYNRKNIILCYPMTDEYYPRTTILEKKSISLMLLTLNIHQLLTKNNLNHIIYELMKRL